MRALTVEEALDVEAELARFLFREARTLDDLRFDDWLGMLSPDIRYRVCLTQQVEAERKTGAAAAPHVAVIADDRMSFLEVRVARLTRGLAACESPASNTRRFVSNVFVDGGANGAAVHSNLAVFQSRMRETWLVGHRSDEFARDDDTGELRLLSRTVVLDHVVMPRTVSVLL